MIPGPGEYISLLMGAPSLTDPELSEAGVVVLERFGSGVRGLLVGPASVLSYKQLVRERLQPGFWNDLVSQDEIVFIFKLADGSLREFTLSAHNQAEVSRLCSQLNSDSLERTSDLPSYFATNPFYRGIMISCYGAKAE